MFLLLGGTGVSYSVQKHHVEKLPEITKPNEKRTRRFLVNDSIEGWAADKGCTPTFRAAHTFVLIFQTSAPKVLLSLLLEARPQDLNPCVSAW